jgi:ArsR family transcriptional regulator
MYETQAELFKALGDPVRLRILALLRVREACVCELSSLLPVSQPAVSQHLRRLRQAGLVAERRHKYWTYYRLHPDLPDPVRRLLDTLPVDHDGATWLQTHQADRTCDASTTSSPS